MKHVPAENLPYVLFTRIGLVTLFAVVAVLVKIVWQRKQTSLEKTA